MDASFKSNNMDQALNIEKFNEFNLLKKDVEEAG